MCCVIYLKRTHFLTQDGAWLFDWRAVRCAALNVSFPFSIFLFCLGSSHSLLSSKSIYFFIYQVCNIFLSELCRKFVKQKQFYDEIILSTGFGGCHISASFILFYFVIIFDRETEWLLMFFFCLFVVSFTFKVVVSY